MKSMLRMALVATAFACVTGPALAKLPAPSEEAQAKAAVAKEKAAEAAKVAADQLSAAQDRVAAAFKAKAAK